MMRDFWSTLLKRKVTQVSDGMGGFTETTSDVPFWGRVCELSGAEVLRNRQIGNEATATLFTEEELNVKDRVVSGAIEYEIVWRFSDFHTRCLLRRVK